jgi:acyl carrier protein
MSDTFAVVRSVIAGVLKIDEEKIELNTRFVEDLKADSMDLFFLIDGFTEKFGVSISDEDAQKIRSVADIVDYIDSHK